ncbi:MAG: hypothetical protein WC817_05035 [Patescibacteria group bacterium]|jgi:hypothetical protein
MKNLTLLLQDFYKNRSFLVVALFSCLFFYLAFFFNTSVLSEHQFTELARSFLHGQLFFLKQPMSGKVWLDAALFNGHYYWPLGPLPAVILIPFVLLRFSVTQGYLNLLLVSAVFYLIFKIAQKIGYTKTESTYWSFAFCFASVFLGVVLVPWSWYLAQTVTVFLLFLSLYEYLNKNRPLVIGVIFGFILLTRANVTLGVLFFILDIVFSSETMRRKIKKMCLLLNPVVVALVIGLFYNYLRFGNFFETGYESSQLLIEPLSRARDLGLFGLVHVPGNLYYFLLSTPLPVFRDSVSHILKFPYLTANAWGMSIFLTSPYFIYLFFLKYRDLFSKMLIVTIVLIATTVLAYYGIGFRQFGYRYSLDFLPFLFVLLMQNYFNAHKNISTGFKALVIVTAIVNLVWFSQIFSFLA